MTNNEKELFKKYKEVLLILESFTDIEEDAKYEEKERLFV